MQLTSYKNFVYRNFASCIESQETTDDLTPSSIHQATLKQFFYTSDQNPKRNSPIERVLKKSEQKIIADEIASRFSPAIWFESRFSNGSYGVVYTAESEETSTKEALYHVRKFYAEELEAGEITAHRRLVKLKVESDFCANLTCDSSLKKNLLTSQTEEGYPYCQEIAEQATESGAQLLRTFSTRDKGGICIPIFNKAIIKKDYGHLKYLRCTLLPDGKTKVVGIREEKEITY